MRCYLHCKRPTSEDPDHVKHKFKYKHQAIHLFITKTANKYIYNQRNIPDILVVSLIKDVKFLTILHQKILLPLYANEPNQKKCINMDNVSKI